MPEVKAGAEKAPSGAPVAGPVRQGDLARAAAKETQELSEELASGAEAKAEADAKARAEAQVKADAKAEADAKA